MFVCVTADVKVCFEDEQKNYQIDIADTKPPQKAKPFFFLRVYFLKFYFIQNYYI